MEDKIYKGISVEECLDKASKDLNISKELLEYKVIEEKKGIFRKGAVISVKLACSTKNEKDGSVSILDGKIIVKNPLEGGKPATITPKGNIKVKIDGTVISERTEVFENNVISVDFNTREAKRELNLNISQDKMKVFLSINYIPQLIYKLNDTPEDTNIYLEECIDKKNYPPKYTISEIKDELAKLSIKQGIIEENIKKASESLDVSDVVIVEGIEPIDDTDDSIELCFNTEGINEDENISQKVDYKNLKSIQVVKKGDVIAIKHPGKKGKMGVDIYGNEIKAKKGKTITIKVGQGAALKDENTVVATMDGKPYMKNNMFYVHEVHEVYEDVGLKTGNIKFIGDVIIHGSIKEGMTIESGNSLVVDGLVESSNLISKGNVTIRSTATLTSVVAGGSDVHLLSYLTNIKELKENLKSMIQTIMEIKKFNLLGKKTTDGEMIKVLIENKFKNVSKLCVTIMAKGKNISLEDDFGLVSLIKQNLIGMAPLEIKHFSVLENIINVIDNNVDNLKDKLSLPVDVKINYCQDCKIESSGNIIITGKGEYVSTMKANKSIYFTEDKSVARGGVLQAEEEIKCKIVGSSGGGVTKLIVSNKGHIWIDVAYQNTVLTVGSKEYVIDVPSKNVHAYQDESGDIIIDKLKL